MKDFLYLASQSASRQRLLHEIGIPFIVLSHLSDEKVMRDGSSFKDYVLMISQHKMDSLVLPTPEDVNKPYMYVLTADTLVIEPKSDCILGKPRDKEDAREMMALLFNHEVHVVTACCLRRYCLDEAGSWIVEREAGWTSSADLMFCVAPDEVDWFIEKEPISLVAAGATIIDGFGQRFLKYLNGSHSAVIGLPLYELTQALKHMGFRFS